VAVYTLIGLDWWTRLWTLWRNSHAGRRYIHLPAWSWSNHVPHNAAAIAKVWTQICTQCAVA